MSLPAAPGQISTAPGAGLGALPAPIRRLRAVRVFGNRFGEFYNDEVISAAGVPGAYLRWRWAADGVVVVPTWHDQVALVPAYKYPVAAMSLELPRGGLNVGETHIDAAVRELAEEAGLLAESTQVLGTVYAETGLIESRCTVVRVTVKSAAFHGASPDPMESVSAPRWLDRRQTTRAIVTGDIQCGVTLAALAIHLASSLSGASE